MQLVRCKKQLLGHERRRRHKAGIAYDGDILHSMRYWRTAVGNVSHAAAQYAAHRQQALGPSVGMSQLRMIESAIRCDVMCRQLVATMRGDA